MTDQHQQYLACLHVAREQQARSDAAQQRHRAFQSAVSAYVEMQALWMAQVLQRAFLVGR